MDSNNRVGKYRVRRRYRGVGPGGRVYEAVHADTGRPAVVVSPGPAEEWSPKAEWHARVSAGLHPPHLTLEVEKAPPGGEVAELTLLLHRLAGVVSRLEGRPDAEAHLAGRQVARRRRRPPARVRWLLVSGNLAALLLLLLWPRALDEATGVPELPDDRVPVSGAVDSPAVIGRGMPKEPYKGQKRAPCTPRVQVEFIGACWLALEAKPPCPEEFVEHAGKCWAPVFTAPREPSSVLP